MEVDNKKRRQEAVNMRSDERGGKTYFSTRDPMHILAEAPNVIRNHITSLPEEKRLEELARYINRLESHLEVEEREQLKTMATTE